MQSETAWHRPTLSSCSTYSISYVFTYFCCLFAVRGRKVCGHFTQVTSVIMPCAAVLGQAQNPPGLTTTKFSSYRPLQIFSSSKIKSHLKGTSFQVIEEIQENVKRQLLAIPKKGVPGMFPSMEMTLDKVASEGDYLEGD